MKQQKFIYQIPQQSLFIVLVSALSCLGGCNNEKTNMKMATEEGEEVKMETTLNKQEDRVEKLECVNLVTENNTPLYNTSSKKSHLEVETTKPDTDQTNKHEETFFFFDPTFHEKEPLESSIVPSITLPKVSTGEKISLDDWSKISESFLNEILNLIANQLSLDPSNLPPKYKTYYKSTFDKYYGLYQMIMGNNKSILKGKGFKTDFLNPLGHFVAIFETQFDRLESHYRENSKDYLTHMERLEKEVFPVAQKTFNAFMKMYEQHSLEKLGMIGPLKYGSQNFSVKSDNIEKYVFYKRDINGDFLLFTLFPHQRIGENLYYSYLPYLYFRNPNCIQDVIIFSLDPTNTPIIDEHPGLLVRKSDIGYTIEPYRGNTTSMPYTTSPSLLLENDDTSKKIDKMFKTTDSFVEKEEPEVVKEKVLEFIENDPPTDSIEPYRGNTTSMPYTTSQTLVLENDDPSKKIDKMFKKTASFMEKEKLEEGEESIEDTFPTELKGKVVFDRFTIERPSNQPRALEKFMEKLLGNNNQVFIPFPHTEREENEETYLFLLALKQRLGEEEEVQSADIHLLNYLENTAFPEKNLDQIIQAYEEDLINDYTNEEEKKIRLEQEARSRMVAMGGLYKKSTNSKKISQTNKKKEIQKTKKLSNKKKGLEEQVTHEDINRSEEELREKARKRLEKLKASNTNGSVKFRKFIQLVNVARQGLEQLDLASTAELNKSSHGTIKVEGATPQTMVRPHGSAKEKAVSSSRKKKILTGLVETMMTNLPRRKQ